MPPVPPAPGANYRTQYSPYISDGNVPLAQALGDSAKKFSVDAFLDLDPRLKQTMATAISEHGHDPFGVYAAVQQPNYQFSLIQRMLADDGLSPLDEGQYVTTDSRGTKSYPDINDVLADIGEAHRGRKVDVDAGVGLRRKDGEWGYGPRTMKKEYAEALRSRLDRAKSAMDDFITQAAPTQERNINNVDYVWTRLGGMPYPGINQGALDYAGTSPTFPKQSQQRKAPQRSTWDDALRVLRG